MSNSTKAKPWGEKHRREAKARLCEVGAMVVHAGRDDWKRNAEAVTNGGSAREEAFERAIRFAREHGANVDERREVRRVRALAEGRLVRETVWMLRWSDGIEVERRDEGRARDLARDNPKARLRRVTRIRRPS